MHEEQDCCIRGAMGYPCPHEKKEEEPFVPPKGLALYIQNLEGAPALCEDPAVWGRWYAGADRIVARDTIGMPGGTSIVIATSFTGMATHYSGHGLPYLWQTLVWLGPRRNNYTRDYLTSTAAIIAHQRLIGLAAAGKL